MTDVWDNEGGRMSVSSWYELLVEEKETTIRDLDATVEALTNEVTDLQYTLSTVLTDLENTDPTKHAEWEVAERLEEIREYLRNRV